MDESIPSHAIEICLHRLLEQTEDFVRREPMKAVAVAIGAGLLLKVLPQRVVIRPLTSIAVQLLPPTLLGFGLLKVFELCCQKVSQPQICPSVEVS
jgi:hypothetical protein